MIASRKYRLFPALWFKAAAGYFQPAIVHASNVYGRYAIPSDALHRPAARIVTKGRVCERYTVRFMRERCGGGDIVHAGAFYGGFLPALDSAMVDGIVWAFEPVPANYACALKTIKLNRLKHVRIQNAALTDKTCTCTMETKGADGRTLGGGSYIQDQGEFRQKVEVVGVRLDEVVPKARHVRILQLDVEGHTKEALLGASEIVQRCKPILILEDFDDEDWLGKVFMGIGYRKTGKVHRNVIYNPNT